MFPYLPISSLLFFLFQCQLLSSVYDLRKKAVVIVLHLHHKTNIRTYVKCVYHVFFITDMFRPQSQFTRLQGVQTDT